MFPRRSAAATVLPAVSPASEDFIIGNVTFALMHEFGHAIIRDFDVPLLGLEEESADTIAAVSLIRLDQKYPNVGFGKALGVTALAQGYVWKSGLEREGGRLALWAHMVPRQRWRLVCLLYGSDPGRMAGLQRRLTWKTSEPEAARTNGRRRAQCGCMILWHPAECRRGPHQRSASACSH
jgi:hypothetical protein